LPPYSRNHQLTAWGERRSVSAWAADDRCSIDYVTILQRVERGWSPEDAITAPSLRRYELCAWGETKRLFEWAEDPRCHTQATTWTCSHESGHIWEARSPHPSCHEIGLNTAHDFVRIRLTLSLQTA
jgi:hypothetical protein